jgi:hypothetical protein
MIRHDYNSIVFSVRKEQDKNKIEWRRKMCKRKKRMNRNSDIASLSFEVVDEHTRITTESMNESINQQTIRAMPGKNHCQIVQRTRGVFNSQICSTITNEEVTSDSLHVGTVGHKIEQDS